MYVNRAVMVGAGITIAVAFSPSVYADISSPARRVMGAVTCGTRRPLSTNLGRYPLALIEHDTSRDRHPGLDPGRGCLCASEALTRVKPGMTRFEVLPPTAEYPVLQPPGNAMTKAALSHRRSSRRSRQVLPGKRRQNVRRLHDCSDLKRARSSSAPQLFRPKGPEPSTPSTPSAQIALISRTTSPASSARS